MLPVCLTCKNSSDDYELLTKSAAQKDFLLPEDTIKLLPFTERANPRQPKFAPMKLFLLKHVSAGV